MHWKRVFSHPLSWPDDVRVCQMQSSGHDAAAAAAARMQFAYPQHGVLHWWQQGLGFQTSLEVSCEGVTLLLLQQKGQQHQQNHPNLHRHDDDDDDDSAFLLGRRSPRWQHCDWSWLEVLVKSYGCKPEDLKFGLQYKKQHSSNSQNSSRDSVC